MLHLVPSPPRFSSEGRLAPGEVREKRSSRRFGMRAKRSQKPRRAASATRCVALHMSALGRRAVQGLTGAVHSAATKPGTERLRFFYLDKRVKGECIRLALVVAGIPFEDVRVSYAEVAAMRDAGRLPFSQVPVMQIGDDPTLHGQSQALLRWAGRKVPGNDWSRGCGRGSGEGWKGLW